MGTVVIGEDWSYCYGVLSALQVSTHRGSAALKAIHAFILRHCPDSLRAKLAEVIVSRGYFPVLCGQSLTLGDHCKEPVQPWTRAAVCNAEGR